MKRIGSWGPFFGSPCRYYVKCNIVFNFSFIAVSLFCGRYVNARQEEGELVNLLYSTPSCYLKALHDSGITWPAFQVDYTLCIILFSVF